MTEIAALPWNGFNAVSTFSGCGGSSLGYKLAGFRVLWANEFIPAAQDVYRLNHPQTILDTRDIRTIQPQDILGATADLNSLMVDRYYTMKAANGYTQEQIERKRLSLEGVLVPVTAHWNEELLRGAGFAEIDCFWRWMNFAGWVAVRR